MRDRQANPEYAQTSMFAQTLSTWCDTHLIMQKPTEGVMISAVQRTTADTVSSEACGQETAPTPSATLLPRPAPGRARHMASYMDSASATFPRSIAAPIKLLHSSCGGRMHRCQCNVQVCCKLTHNTAGSCGAYSAAPVPEGATGEQRTHQDCCLLEYSGSKTPYMPHPGLQY